MAYDAGVMIWELYQQGKIVDAENVAQRAMSKADRYAADIAQVQRQVERLSLACQAMWELLRERSGLTELDIENKMLEVDGRDGEVDGKIATQHLQCHVCGRPTNSRRTFCVMCGAPFQRQHVFET